MTKEQYEQLTNIYDAINAQLILLDAFMDANRPVKENRQEFLNELSANDVNYRVAYIAEAESEPQPEIPSDDELGNAAEQLANSTAKGDEQPPKDELVEEVKKRLDLEPEKVLHPEMKSIIEVLFEQQNKPEWTCIETESALFKNFCAWVINGEKDTAFPVTDARLFFMQEQKKVRFTKKDFDHIQNLRWWRSELLKGKDGDFSLKEILNQNSTFDWEKPLWEALAKTIK